jgi:hypothetical protein
MLMNVAESRFNCGDEARWRFFNGSQRAMNFLSRDVESDAIGCLQWSKFIIGP